MILVLPILLTQGIVIAGVPSACPCGPVGGSSSYSYSNYRVPSTYVAPPKPKVYTKTRAQKRRARRRESARKKAEKQLKREVIRVRLEDAPSVSVTYADEKKVVGTVALGHDRERYILFNEKRSRGKRTGGTRIPTEGLRRSLGIIRTMLDEKGQFRQDMSFEDMSFSGNQAALAMAGEPLHVYIAPGPAPRLSKTQAKELNVVIQRVQKSSARASRLTERRVAFEKELLRKQVGPIDSTLSYSERGAAFAKLENEFEELKKEEKDAHKKVAKEKKQVTKVIKKALNFEVELD